MKWLLIFCLLAVHHVNAMPNKEEEEVYDSIEEMAPESRGELQKEESNSVNKRDAEFDAAEKEEDEEKLVNRRRKRNIKPRAQEEEEEEEEDQNVNSRNKRDAGPDNGDGSSEENLDVDVNVNINAPQPNLKADVDVNVNINAVGDGAPDPEEQYSLCPMCGTRYNDRIVGGQDAAPGSWPWMAHLNVITGYSNYSCGGAIITRDTILTAAHCIAENTLGAIESVVVTVGSVEVPSSGGLTYKVAYQTSHVNYNPTTLENDIALLKLEEQLTFTRNVRPVCLGDADMIYEGRKIEATGWGRLDYYDDGTPTHLQEVTLDIISNVTCQQLYPRNIIDERQFCTLTPNKDACSGDSGGPMVVEEGDKWYELGLVSYGLGCALPDGPNVGTKVPYFKSWILENIGNIICE